MSHLKHFIWFPLIIVSSQGLQIIVFFCNLHPCKCGYILSCVLSLLWLTTQHHKCELVSSDFLKKLSMVSFKLKVVTL